MQKPIKPPRPRLNDEKPSRTKRIDTALFVKDGELDLKIDSSKCWENGWYRYWGDFDKKIYEFIGESIKQIGVMYPVEDFLINCDYNKEISVTIFTKKSEEVYKQELLDFESRFENYKASILKYEEELQAYENWAREQRIKKLQQEIESLNGNKS